MYYNDNLLVATQLRLYKAVAKVIERVTTAEVAEDLADEVVGLAVLALRPDCVAETPPGETNEDRWNADTIQFPRLLDEIRAVVTISPQDWEALRESTDLTTEELNELFDRAGRAFELIKRRV